MEAPKKKKAASNTPPPEPTKPTQAQSKPASPQKPPQSPPPPPPPKAPTPPTAPRSAETPAKTKPKAKAPPSATPPPTPAPAPAKKAAAKPSAPPPPILLEGDASPTPPVGGPGSRYVLAPAATPTASLPILDARELPQAYGTRRLLLVARDPHWVYAHWDLTDDQLREANRKSAAGSLTLRVRAGSPTAEVVAEQTVHPESRNWFVHVPQAGGRYLAELGYFDKAGAWTQVSVSAATLTPRDDLSEETWVRFETLPFDIPMSRIVALVQQAIADNSPLLEAIQQLRLEGHPDLPLVSPTPAGGPPSIPRWTPAQEQALAQVLSLDEVRRVWIGSLEITELLRRQLQRGISSASLPIGAPGPAGAESAAGLGSLSSPFGGAAPGARGFWFNVNAELVVYGATDPKATVTIGDRTIRLRPDGTFSYRFALPDGDYRLPIAATSPDGVEQRRADLSFRRASEYRGDVPPHPQDPGLQTPSPDHVA